MNTLPPLPVSFARGQTPRLLLTAILLTGVSDFLLWPAKPGLSLALWWGVLLAALLASQPRLFQSRTQMGLAGLLLATAVQSAVEISFSNVLVAVALGIALMGEGFYAALSPGWARFSEVLWAFAKAPGRWGCYTDALTRAGWTNRGAAGNVFRLARIVIPAVVVCALFLPLLGSGNAIFGKWLIAFGETFARWITLFDLSFAHLLFYAAVATLSLVLVNPSAPSPTARFWTREIPRLPMLNASIAWWRSVAILAALNLLFFAVNTIDVFYLWGGGAMPVGVGYSQYVHDGVFSLVIAVLFSAGVLTALFQQAGEISRSPALKRLGYAWIVQNGLLIASVQLRLMRYVEAYQFTTQRVYAAFFVLLVAAGFALLAVHIARGDSLNRLILNNAVATLALFFTIQFLDVAGWVARANVGQWERDPQRTLDINYLVNLGPSAWPALARATQSHRSESRAAQQRLAGLKKEIGEKAAAQNWRSWQGRRAMAEAWLVRR